MMGLDERLFYLLLGVAIGFIIGYITRMIQKIEKEVSIIKKNREEGGFMRKPILADAAILLTVLLTVFAAFQSNQASREVVENSERDQHVVSCIVTSSTKLLNAVNERTSNSAAQGAANIALQEAQSAFIANALQEPPLEPDRVEEALTIYFAAISDFVEIQSDTLDTQSDNPYPTDDELQACIDNEN